MICTILIKKTNRIVQHDRARPNLNFSANKNILLTAAVCNDSAFKIYLFNLYYVGFLKLFAALSTTLFAVTV